MPLARQTLCSSSALAVSRAGASQAESGPTIAREKLLPDWRADAWRRLEGSWRGSWACVAETSGWLYAACDLPSCATTPVSAAPAKANHPERWPFWEMLTRHGYWLATTIVTACICIKVPAAVLHQAW